MILLLQNVKKGAVAAARHKTSQHSSHVLRWLLSLGGLGLFAVAIVDSSVIPLPLPGSTDLLLLLLTSRRGMTYWVAGGLALSALAGSLIGGYLTYGAGRKGGEATLAKKVPKKFLDKLNGWVEHRGSLSVGLAAFLPPPIPLTPFLLAAGALGMPRGQFLWSYGVGRMLRYGLLAWLGMTFGRHVVRVWETTLSGWSARILWAYAVLVALGVAYGIWKYLRGRRSGGSSVKPAAEPEPDAA
jgi:membrane protein DedA with SNARE-associated domain